MRDPRINSLRSNIHPVLHRCMDRKETLGLENLRLDEPCAPRNVRRLNRVNGRWPEPKAPLLLASQQASGQHTSSISPWDPTALPSYQLLPIAPLSGSASTDTLNPWLTQLYYHGFGQRFRVNQLGFTTINGRSTVPGVTALPFVQPRPPSRGLGSTVRKSTLSVFTHRCLLFSRVDKQCRYSKANPPCTEGVPVQRGKLPRSPPAALGEALSQPGNCSLSTNTRDLEATLPAAHEPSPFVVNAKDDLIHLPAPIPTLAYLRDAHAVPNVLSSPQHLLLVLDLNGTLLYRSRASQSYTPRPCLHNFLKYAFANHSLLVWSSAQPYNVKGVCRRLFTPDERKLLLGEWGRDTLGLTSAQYKKRVQVYKRLDRIWSDENLQHSHPGFKEGERWNQRNTLLIDGEPCRPDSYCNLDCKTSRRSHILPGLVPRLQVGVRRDMLTTGIMKTVL